jgi:SPP1 family predicted phage head-tail adaptor
MRAGDLNRRITIEQRAHTSSRTTKNSPLAWSPVATVWAAVNYRSGEERNAARQGGEVAVARTEFTIRAMSGLDTTMRVRYDGKLFNMRFINDVFDAHRSMILTCDTGASEGA